MNFDIDKILNDEYLNDLLSQINKKIAEVSSYLSNNYTFDEIMAMDDVELNELFSKYDVSIDEISKYKNVSISLLSAYSDLFPASNMKLLKEHELRKQSVQGRIDELNSKIDLTNDKLKDEVNKLNKTLELVKLIASILKRDEVISDEDIKNLTNLIINSDLSNDDKFNLSYILSKYLINKNITLLNRQSLDKKNENVDTTEFEDALSDVYDGTGYDNSESVEEVVIEDKKITYADTILSYYKKYEQLFKNIGLGDSFDDILLTAWEMSNGVSTIGSSVSKEDFGICLASLLYSLRNIEEDNDTITSVIKELEKLDKLYDEYIKISDERQSLLEEMKDDLSVLRLYDNLEINNFDVSDTIEKLEDLLSKLGNNIITGSELKKINDEYILLESEISSVEEIIDALSRLENLNTIIKDKMVVASSSTYDTKYFEQLAELQGSVVKIYDEIDNIGVSKEIIEMIDTLTTQINKLDYDKVFDSKDGKPITLKGFVLFDFGADLVPYVISDLDPASKHNFIDKGVEPGKLIAGYETYDKLIRDLLLFGDIEKLYNNEVKGYNIYKCIDLVFKDLSSRSMKNATGMYRIRPQRNGVARFIEQKVVFHPGTKLYEQITGIIKEILSGVTFNNEDDLSIYINFASAMKRVDVDTYKEAIKRYGKHSPLYKLFINDMSNKDKLTDEECNLLRDFIHMSLNAYSELAKKNPSLKFDIIEKIGGMNKHEL